jgi:hypothetical protein
MGRNKLLTVLKWIWWIALTLGYFALMYFQTVK